MSLRRYLVDSNVLSRLSSEQRTSTTFGQKCVLIEDVWFESRGFAEDSLGRLVRLPTRRTLARLGEIMASIPPGDYGLVDLYDNKGMADPALVAYAVALTDEERDALLPVEWVLVTEDKALTDKATEFNIAVITREAFLAVLAQE